MSAFLGPIHHWLFKKIVLFEELEKNIIADLSRKYGESAIEKISEESKEQFGAFLPQKPLEMLIDTDNIHGWLQNRIAIAETRQAFVIKKVLEGFGKEALEIIEEAYVKQGKEIGRTIQNSKPNLSAAMLYQELNNYILEGMPCDNANNVIVSRDDEIQWQVTHCLHKPYWDKVLADTDIMYNLRFLWIKGFIEYANPRYTYIVDRRGADVASLHTIVLK